MAQDLIKPSLGESHDKVLGAALLSHYFVSDLSENTWKLSMKLPVTDLWYDRLSDRYTDPLKIENIESMISHMHRKQVNACQRLSIIR